MNGQAFPKMTPWVARLIAINAVVMLILATVLTSPAIREVLVFAPAVALERPWTFISYMFVHQGFWHLLANMLGLYIFGTAVEGRMGSRGFLFFYLFCGVGAAVFSLGLSGFLTVSPFLGASGAVLGVALAFALLWPDAEILLFPIPAPVRVRTLVSAIAGVSLFAALIFQDSGIAHIAHLGGMLFAWLFFRVQAISSQAPVTAPRPVERVVMVQAPAREDAEPEPAHPAPRRAAEPDPVAAEIDRVLDKINAQGMHSLTAEERRFLSEIAQKKRGDHV